MLTDYHVLPASLFFDLYLSGTLPPRSETQLLVLLLRLADLGRSRIRDGSSTACWKVILSRIHRPSTILRPSDVGVPGQGYNAHITGPDHKLPLLPIPSVIQTPTVDPGV